MLGERDRTILSYHDVKEIYSFIISAAAAEDLKTENPPKDEKLNETAEKPDDKPAGGTADEPDDEADQDQNLKDKTDNEEEKKPSDKIQVSDLVFFLLSFEIW